MGQQKSAEAIVGLSPQTEGLNMLNGMGTGISTMTVAPDSQPEIVGAIVEGSGQHPREQAIGGANHAVLPDASHEGLADLLSAVLERSNMLLAYDRVLRNKGAPGVDGLTVGELKAYLQHHWQQHKADLLSGSYQPQPVRKVEIPKPGGGVRQLGIPTVLDRLIQQALHQVLSPLFDPTFSESSYGFRPVSYTHLTLPTTPYV